MRVPWTARRLNQSILKESSPEYSLKGLMFCVSFPRAHLEQGTAVVGPLSGELGSLLAQEAGKVSDSERAVGSSLGN